MTFDQPLRRLPVFWGSLILFLLVLAGGIVLTNFVSHYGENLEREELKLLAAKAAASFDTNMIRKLQGKPSDIGTKVFDQVRGQLQKIHQVNPDSRFVYLMARKKDQVVFLADAEPHEFNDYSAPGEVYTEASPPLHRMFSQGKPFTEGPFQDRWGVWITGLAPLVDLWTGQVIAVLGIDVRADQWLASVSRYKWFSMA